MKERSFVGRVVDTFSVKKRIDARREKERLADAEKVVDIAVHQLLPNRVKQISEARIVARFRGENVLVDDLIWAGEPYLPGEMPDGFVTDMPKSFLAGQIVLANRELGKETPVWVSDVASRVPYFTRLSSWEMTDAIREIKAGQVKPVPRSRSVEF